MPIPLNYKIVTSLEGEFFRYIVDNEAKEIYDVWERQLEKQGYSERNDPEVRLRGEGNEDSTFKCSELRWFYLVVDKRSRDEEKYVELKRKEAEERKKRELRLSYAALFDRKKYGINFYFGAGYFLASIFGWFSWPIVVLLQGHKPIFQPFGYYVGLFIMTLLASVSFLAVSHLVKKNLLLPFIWGLCRVILGIFYRGVILSLFVKSQETSNLGQVFDLNIMVISFIVAFLFMAGIILSIYYWKIKPWSLIIGITIAGIISQIITCIILKDISFSLSNILSAVISDIIYGVLLYAGFALHFRRKSIEQLPISN